MMMMVMMIVMSMIMMLLSSLGGWSGCGWDDPGVWETKGCEVGVSGYSSGIIKWLRVVSMVWGGAGR